MANFLSVIYICCRTFKAIYTYLKFDKIIKVIYLCFVFLEGIRVRSGIECYTLIYKNETGFKKE
jgi:hypothetical protein